MPEQSSPSPKIKPSDLQQLNLFPNGFNINPNSGLAQQLGKKARDHIADKLVENIETLIRTRDSAALKRLLGRSPIRGKLGERVAGEVAPGTIQPDLTVLEHGVLIPVASNPSFPLTQNVTAYVDQYFTGGGTPIPDQGVNQYLVGPAEKTDSICGTAENYVYSWPSDGTPYVGVYDSILYVDSNAWNFLTQNQFTNVWSGLALLLAQVCIGTKRTMTSIVSGVGWSANPDTDGLVRFWDASNLTYRYWYTKNTIENGLQAIELVPSGDGLCPLTWLNAHKQGLITLSQNDIQMMETWVMRKFVTTGSISTLISSSGLSTVWDDGADAVHYGWGHSFQQLGMTGEDKAEATITTLWEEVTEYDPDPPNNPTHTHHHGATYRITYSLTGTDLTATLSTVQQGTMHIENTVIALWKPKDGGGLTLYYSQLNDPDLNDASMPVYSFFDYDGSLQILEYIKHFANTSGTSRNYIWEDTYHCVDTTRGHIGYCTNETAPIYRKDERSTFSAGGGWKISNVDASRIIGVGGGISLETKIAYPPTLGAEMQCCMDTWNNQNPSPSELRANNAKWCDGAAQAWFDGICAGKYSCNTHEVYSMPGEDTRMTYQTDRYSADSSHAKGAIIPVNQRNGVYLCQAMYYKDHYSTNREKLSGYSGGPPSCPNDPFCGGSIANFAQFKFVLKTQDEVGGEETFHTSPWFTNGWGSCELRDDWCGVVAPWSDTPNTTMEDYIMSSWLVSAEGTKTLSTSWDDWVPFAGGSQGDPDRGWNASFVLTYYDTAVWWYDQPNDFRVHSDFPGSPSTHVYIPSGFI